MPFRCSKNFWQTAQRMSSLRTDATLGHWPCLTAAEMQALEATAFAEGRLQSLEAMETAGQGAAEIIRGWPGVDVAAREALILCGPGNNGGDGYVIARALAEDGWRMTVCALGAPKAEAMEAVTNRARWETLGPVGDLFGWNGGLPAGAVVVDALFGIGLRRGLDLEAGIALDRIGAAARRAGAAVFAIDVPSGLCADTGRALGPVLPAHCTITFHTVKPAHLGRPDLCGQVQIVDIGL